MNLISGIIKHIPGVTLECLYNSKLGRLFVALYEFLNRGDSLKTYRITENLLMEADLSKPAERALPFGAYEPAITERFLGEVTSEKVVFDIGSWIGYYALLAASKGAVAIAIEPDLENCNRINRNIELNKYSNVTVNVAVGEEESHGVILKGQVSSTHEVVTQGTENVLRIRKLDNIIQELGMHKVDLMMIDIQGFEYYAIKVFHILFQLGKLKKLFVRFIPSN